MTDPCRPDAASPSDNRPASPFASAFEQPLSFAYRPPRSLLLLQILAFVLAFYAIAMALLSAAVKWLCYVVLAVYLLRQLDRFLTAGAAQVLHLSATDEWYLYTATEKQKLTLRHDVLIHHRIAVLNFHDAAKRRYDFILTRENADAEMLRVLRVRLRHKRQVWR